MARRPARCYTKITGPPYTRKKYVRSIPGSKITSFEAGNKQAKFPISISLFSKEACQIRHVALDALRMMSNRHMQRKAGAENYHLIVRVYPHHILRENKMMAFAGADRLQDGMRRAFGKPMDVCARVKAKQAIITIRTFPEHVEKAFLALKVGGDKLPTPYYIKFEKGEEIYNDYLKKTVAVK
ncbi:MAG: 50S ribosomal protein L16 [Candidatus Gerdarchaeota archaeon]|nr:MAG: 50S ribosomal protein L16 [Candidatus Gerdarchaeota archaeon]RLI69527.1 MAG: 50S ribosomal protein L16 [Candidatus Gerdarchaeota archaeon]